MIEPVTVAAVAFLLSWLIEQRPLRESLAAGNGVGGTFAMPRPTDSLAEASRARTALVGSDGRRQLVERLAERAGLTVSAAASWLIVRLHEDPRADIALLCRDFDLPVATGERAWAELVAAGLISDTPVAGSSEAGPPVGTPAGEEVARRLTEEPRASLARLCAGWVPEENRELADLLVKLAHDLVREPRAHDTAAP